MLFSERPKVGQWEMKPLTAGRIVMLEERGNPLLGKLKAGDEVRSEWVFELLMVCAMDPRELARLSRSGDEEWRDEVGVFGMDVTEAELTEIWEIVEAEFSAIEKVKAEPKKKAARKTTRKKARR